MTDDAIDRAVAEQAAWMEDLLVALVEAPTVLGHEEPGQALMERAFADCGMDHPINLNPGVLSGGDWTSTVPAEATLSCRLATYPGQDPAELQRRVEQAVARAGAGATVRYDGFRCEGCAVARDEPVVLALSDAYRSVHHGAAPALLATTATTDARHFVARGIPAICFGPRAEEIHGIDERVSRSSMAEVARTLARFLVRWCGESNDDGSPETAAHGGESRHVHR